jgi:hypothetical protein
MTAQPAIFAGPPLRMVPRTVWHDGAMRRVGIATATGPGFRPARELVPPARKRALAAPGAA